MACPSFTYLGKELELFEHATNWKAYWRSQVRPYLVGEVLEVGAGIGSTTRFLCDGRQQRWIALEPDAALAAQIHQRTPSAEVIVGTVADLGPGFRCDAILYIDVLEHIEADRTELEAAARLLRPHGALVVLAPAHQWLYTPFDAHLGHYRRYSTRTLQAAVPPSLSLERLIYLDAVGLLASLGNRLFLRRALPTAQQLRVWDRWMVPLSRWLDPALRYHVGKSVLGVWRLR